MNYRVGSDTYFIDEREFKKGNSFRGVILYTPLV